MLTSLLAFIWRSRWQMNLVCTTQQTAVYNTNWWTPEPSSFHGIGLSNPSTDQSRRRRIPTMLHLINVQFFTQSMIFFYIQAYRGILIVLNLKMIGWFLGGKRWRDNQWRMQDFVKREPFLLFPRSPQSRMAELSPPAYFYAWQHAMLRAS